MSLDLFKIRDDYWETFEIVEEDVEFLYSHLLEIETPLSPRELLDSLISDRLKREKKAIEKQRRGGGDIYLPKDSFKEGQELVFPALAWRRGKVQKVRPGLNPDLKFEVIQVEMDDGEVKEFASEIKDHFLNAPQEIEEDDKLLNPQAIINEYGENLESRVIDGLSENKEFVYIAGRWFPKALLIDVNEGHLNLAEAVLDVAQGGPIPTGDLLDQVDLPDGVNPKLAEFSLDLALQEDNRFDEVGPAGEVLWFLRRLEPNGVLETPEYLRYHPIDHDRDVLSMEMLQLENLIDDELSPLEDVDADVDEVEVRLIFPHWKAGTLPLSHRVSRLFPTAYESPRIRFILVDGKTGDKFPGWVVRLERYVYGLREWYEARGLIPGSLVKIRKGEQPGEVIVDADSKRSTREWIRTVLVGSDQGIVFAMLKHVVQAAFDERMAIMIPDESVLNDVWDRMMTEDRPPFERVVVDTMRELAKLNPQNHVHVSELYAAVNAVYRCPPAPIMALLASRPWFVHVGDLHFRFEETDNL